MALRLSTGLRNALLDRKATANNIVSATTISFESGTGTDGRDRIVDAGSGLGGFVRRGKITISGSASNDMSIEALAVADGYIEVAGSTLTDEGAGGAIVLSGAKGGSFSDIFQNCVAEVYTGSQPSSADAGATGTKLLRISLNSGPFTPGSSVSGLNFGEVAAGVLKKEAGEIWSGEGLADGPAGWFRIYDNDYVTGASTDAIRMDGAVATSGAQFNMSNTSVSVGGTTTVDSVALTLPAS